MRHQFAPTCARALALLLAFASAHAETIAVDAGADQHAISPLIYGVAFADAASLAELGCPLNRYGGNATTRYNWKINATNHDDDWYFESIDDGSSIAANTIDSFIATAQSGGAQPLISLSMIGWVAKLGTSRSILPSFSQAKYGAQQASDPYLPDAGNGVLSSGADVTGNDPNDADVPADTPFEQGLVQHLVSKWGASAAGGVRYYLLDNEQSIWHQTHRDVHPSGAGMDEIGQKMVDYATMVKSVDAGALVVGPEEWGWDGYLYSGADQQYGAAHGWSSFPDRAAHGNMDYVPWLLQHLQSASTSAGKRLLDICSVHWYPQGGEFSDDASTAMQLLRNQSTRALWDASYVDQSWVNTQVYLIPRLKQWVASYYPGTKVALTEYNWGAEASINGATAQADIYGILGRESCDLATRWTLPANTTPTYLAMKMYGNYDGQHSRFGDQSVRATVANPDNLAAFAAVRSADGALTVMLVHKELTASDSATVTLANFSAASAAHVWQLSSANTIAHLADVAVTTGGVQLTVPAQTVTLLVIPASGGGTTATGTATGTTTTGTTSGSTASGSASATATATTGTTGATSTGSSGSATSATSGSTGAVGAGGGSSAGGCGIGGLLGLALGAALFARRRA